MKGAISNVTHAALTMKTLEPQLPTALFQSVLMAQVYFQARFLSS